MNLKGIEWNDHPIDLANRGNYTEFYLGINPRGLVPTLVHDGEVHIESNDILVLLEERFPDNKLIPPGMHNKVSDLLRHEDDLHLDLRTITFRFTQPRGKEPRSKETLRNYRDRGSGTVRGKKDPHKQVELNFWETAAGVGITDEAVRLSAGKFKKALDNLNEQLAHSRNLLVDNITILDVAWVIYVNRLIRCGYPLERLHPRVNEWFWPLRNRDEFDRELQVTAEVQEAIEDHHALQKKEGRTLVEVAGL